MMKFWILDLFNCDAEGGLPSSIVIRHSLFNIRLIVVRISNIEHGIMNDEVLNLRFV